MNPDEQAEHSTEYVGKFSTQCVAQALKNKQQANQRKLEIELCSTLAIPTWGLGPSCTPSLLADPSAPFADPFVSPYNAQKTREIHHKRKQATVTSKQGRRTKSTE